MDTDELNEELEELNCVREDYSDGATGIGPEELDLIIDLCNGREIPADRRLSLLRAIHHIRDTQIERSILESINGSDSRISKFLDEAEQNGRCFRTVTNRLKKEVTMARGYFDTG